MNKSLCYSFQLNFLDQTDFIKHWSAKYEYLSSMECRYEENIGKCLTPERIEQLFVWKNGSKLSSRKLQRVQDNYTATPPENFPTRYLDHKQAGGAIWNIFYLHCIAPNEFAIFDQHAYRAMNYLKTATFREIPKSNREKYRIYLDEYQPFVKSINGFDLRTIDRALFAFGKFLKVAAQYS